MKYIRKFENHTAYEAAKSGLILPNVSLCAAEHEVRFNPFVDTRLIITYSIVDASEPTFLYDYYTEEGQEEYWIIGVDLFDKIEIDGTEVSITDLDTAGGMYQFSVGEHTIAYTLKDPTSIGFHFDNIGFTSIIIPNTVTSIDEYLFRDFTELESVTLSDSLTMIDEGTFVNCTSLASITIPNSVTTIGERAFGECTSLTSVTIPNSVTTIGDSAFSGCTSLTTVTLGSGVQTIGDSAFCGCPLVSASENAIEAINLNATVCGGIA